ncbi:MAG TPA: hypothetical protein VD913_00890 [bacterium]|nr:hypothetical protein [bacterium]
MKLETLDNHAAIEKVSPKCPIFGICGGCAYQDLPYEEELRIKAEGLRDLFRKELAVGDEIFDDIVASPLPYHYRSRLDLGLLRTKSGEFFMGFMPQNSGRIVPAESCAIAREEISHFLPELKKQAMARLPENYRVANLVVRTGDDGRLFWGGIGRRSLKMQEKDYFWTEVRGKRIFYSLDTFFQANLSILGLLMDQIEEAVKLDSGTVLYDLYSGVGLFGISLAGKVKKVIMIEESEDSTVLAGFNLRYHGQESKIEILTGKVEDYLPLLPQPLKGEKAVAVIDPPRKGLHAAALKALAAFPGTLLYLSCYPPSLVRDLKEMTREGRRIEKVIPFDFFPKTPHLETLVKLSR